MTVLATELDRRTDGRTDERSDEQSEVADLVRGAAAGDEASWAMLVDRFSRLVWSIARGFMLTDADAADVCQTAWLRLAEHLDRIEHPERVGAWLATTTRRECMRIKRLSHRTIPSDDLEEAQSDHFGHAIGADSTALLGARDELVHLALSRLSERNRSLLLLLVADPPLSYIEISDMLGMPVGSIGPTRARTLALLRRRIEAAGIFGSDARAL